LLGDCTVVHNTTLIANTCRAYPGLTIVLTTPGEDLCRQLRDDLRAMLPGREIKLLGAGSSTKFQSEDITVCSMDALHKCDHGRTDLLIVDEPHACVTDDRMLDIQKFSRARKLGFGATIGGRFDKRDRLIEGLIGPVLVRRTYTEAVAEGAICPIVVIFLRVEMAWRDRVSSRDMAYRRHLFLNPDAAHLVSRVCREAVPADWQTLIFIKNEPQAELYLERFAPGTVVAMAKQMTRAERAAKYEMMRSGEIKRCLATKIYSTGVTFSDLKVIVNCEGGGDNNSAIQKPGRLAEIRPGKRCGVLIDLHHVCPGLEDADMGDYDGDKYPWKSLIADSAARRTAYARKGYEVRDASCVEDLARQLAEVAA